MSDFDITNIRSKSSFVNTLMKRKALGLLDSDSEDEAPRKKKPSNKKDNINISLSDDEQEKSNDISSNNDKDNNKKSDSPKIIQQEVQIDMEEPVIPTVNPYIKKGPDFDFIKSLSTTHTVHLNQNTNTTNNLKFKEKGSVIELSDEEVVIESLPELEAILNSTTMIQRKEPLKINVVLKYVHNFKNVSEQARKVIDRLLKPIKIIIMDNTPFRIILEQYCTHKKLKIDDVVLVYNEDSVYLNGTPAGLDFSATSDNQMRTVYPKACYQALLDEKEREKQERRKKWSEHKDKETEKELDFLNSMNESKDDDNKLLIKLRGSDNSDVVVRVKTSSTIESVILKYKEIKGISSNVKLSFEGQVLDPASSIEDADLEDEDLVEVIIS